MIVAAVALLGLYAVWHGLISALQMLDKTKLSPSNPS
jgi:hypothetical protein